MNNLIARMLAHPIEGSAPTITEIAHPILVAGMSMSTDVRRIYRDVPKLAKRFEAFKQAHKVPNRREPWGFAAVSRGFDKATGGFSYALGDVVTSFENLPQGLEAIEIPAMTYAVFQVRPRSRFGWGVAIARAKAYAYDTWLPDSGYQPGRLIDDFEYHDDRSTRARDPEIDLHICIRRREGPPPETA